MSRLSFIGDLAGAAAKGLTNLFKGAAKGADEVARVTPAARQATSNAVDMTQESNSAFGKTRDMRASQGYRPSADDVSTPALVHPTTGKPITSRATNNTVNHEDIPLNATQRGLIPALLHHSGLTSLFQIPWVAKTGIAAVALTGAFVINPLDKSSTGGVINGTIPNLMGAGAIPMFVPKNWVQSNAAFVEGEKNLNSVSTERENQEAKFTEAQAGQQTQARALEYESSLTILQNGTPEQKNSVLEKISLEVGVGKNRLTEADEATRRDIYKRVFENPSASPEVLAYRKRFAESMGIDKENPGLVDIELKFKEMAENQSNALVQRAAENAMAVASGARPGGP